MSTVIIDNFDSFTGNLAQLAGAIEGVDPLVVPNTIAWNALIQLHPDRVILSPGPGHPCNTRDFGICRRVIEELDVPILGVCLGHQGICLAFGGRVIPSFEPVHGRAGGVFHTADELFAGVPSPFSAVRYHSLEAELGSEGVLESIAWTDDRTIMAVRHRTRPVWGVQFHPESVLTEHGGTILRNFLQWRQSRLHWRRMPWNADAANLYRGLFSGRPNAFWLDSAHSAGFSYLGSSEEVLEGELFGRLARELAARKAPAEPSLPFPFQGGWVGYFGYEAKAELGSPCRHHAPTPNARFLFADRFLALDHESHHLWMVFRTADDAAASRWFDETEGAIRAMRSSDRNRRALGVETLDFAVPREVYRASIGRCLDEIRRGESYEICLTNRLRGRSEADPLDYYENLRCTNPAPYAAFLQFPDFQIACSSPELFLSVSRGGHAVSKPMKGTAGRSATASEDVSAREELRHDEKNRAENLMIVDLTRNDLGRVCETGSIKVTSLMDIETFATVHQMVSTIEGQLRPGLNAIDCLRSAFPPGSMTGAPKLRTMEIIDAVETEARGVYSGCLGFLSVDGAAQFNVVIRSAVFANGEVGIGSGGAIVAQSSADCEWNELVLKTSALARAFLSATRDASRDS